MSTKTYEVPAISCGHCTATIERELKFVDGVQGVKAELETKRVTVEVENDDVSGRSGRNVGPKSAILLRA